MGFWKGTARYMARRVMYDAVRSAARDARLATMQEYDQYTITVHVGETVTWHHPQGFSLRVEIVEIDGQRAKIRVMHKGKQEEMWVGSDSLSVRRTK